MSGMDQWIAFDKADFIGRDAALKERDPGGGGATWRRSKWPPTMPTRLATSRSGARENGSASSPRAPMGISSARASQWAIDRESAGVGTDLTVHVVGVERGARVIARSPYDPAGQECAVEVRSVGGRDNVVSRWKARLIPAHRERHDQTLFRPVAVEGRPRRPERLGARLAVAQTENVLRRGGRRRRRPRAGRGLLSREEHGVTRVAVLEKGWLGGGNTGRNTTVVRSNYFFPESVALYDFALRLYKGLAASSISTSCLAARHGDDGHSEHEIEVVARSVNAMQINGVDVELLLRRARCVASCRC